MNKIGKAIYSIGLVIMLLSGTVYGISNYSSYESVLLAISLVIICVSCGKIYIHTYSKNIVSKIFVVFICFIAISFIAHPETSIIITVFGLVLISFTLMVQIPGMKKAYNWSYEDDQNILLISLLLIQIFSLLHGFTTYRFAGIYSNSNYTGGEAATLCAVACSVFLQNFYGENNKKKNIIPSIGIILSFIVGIATNSRTSIGVIIIELFITGIFILKAGKSKKLIIRAVSITSVTVIGMIVLYKQTIVNTAINEIITKFVRRQGNELAGRQDMWDVVFNRLSFFGNGEATAFGTHNTFLSMLDQYGYIPCGLLIMFVGLGICLSLVLAFRKKNYDMKYLPLYSFICFGITCLFEQMLLKNIMLLCLYSVPIISQIRQKYYTI